MKRKIMLFCVATFCFFTLTILCQVTGNPPKPEKSITINTIQLKEVMRITDDSGDFYFKYPQILRVAADGSFFIADEKLLLKFDASGTLKGNFFKKGEGPGEIRDFFDFILGNDAIYIHDAMANKIIQLNMKGTFIKEARLPMEGMDELVVVTDKGFICTGHGFPAKRDTPKLYDLPYGIFLLSTDFKTKTPISTFPVKRFLAPGAAMVWARFRYTLKDEATMFVSHTTEYSLKKVDLKNGLVLKTFKREYKRVKRALREFEKNFHNRYNAPKREYENDIQGLFVFKSWLWVKTSTRNSDGMALYDVYDAVGEYSGYFYLNSSDHLMAAAGDCVFILQHDEEENPVIVKYRVMNFKD